MLDRWRLGYFCASGLVDILFTLLATKNFNGLGDDILSYGTKPIRYASYRTRLVELKDQV